MYGVLDEESIESFKKNTQRYVDETYNKFGDDNVGLGKL